MPTINKPQKKTKSTFHNDTDMRQLRQKAYQSSQWKAVRSCYLHSHPICIECLKNGVVNAGSVANPLQVHHKQSPFKNSQINYDLLCDTDNLETICSTCHALIHQKEKGYKSPEDVLKELMALFDEGITDEELES